MSEIGIGLVGYKFMGRAHSNAYRQVAHFFDALRKSCPGLNQEELKVLKERLDEHCKARKAELEKRKNQPGQR